MNSTFSAGGQSTDGEGNAGHLQQPAILLHPVNLYIVAINTKHPVNLHIVAIHTTDPVNLYIVAINTTGLHEMLCRIVLSFHSSFFC